MVGTGLTPEGIHNSYPMYDLMLENGWRKRPVEDVDKWFEEFSGRRYGPFNNVHMENAWIQVRVLMEVKFTQLSELQKGTRQDFGATH